MLVSVVCRLAVVVYIGNLCLLYLYKSYRFVTFVLCIDLYPIYCLDWTQYSLVGSYFVIKDS